MRRDRDRHGDADLAPDRVPRRSEDHPERCPVALTMAVVRHGSGPDRCTVFPSEATEFDRLSTWLSVDRSAVIDLERNR